MMRFVGILVLIAAFVWLAIFGGPEGCSVEEAKLVRVRSDEDVIANAIRTYAASAGRPPSTEQGLGALVKEPTAGPKPLRWIQVMRYVPTDPWGNDYKYRIVSEGDVMLRYELSSAGKDGIVQTEDDRVKEIDWQR